MIVHQSSGGIADSKIGALVGPWPRLVEAQHGGIVVEPHCAFKDQHDVHMP